MGESVVAVARPHIELVGRVLMAAVLTSHNRAAMVDVVLCATLEMVLVPGTTECGLLEGHIPQPLGEGPLLAFLEGHAQRAS